jgi:hypothetical protein
MKIGSKIHPRTTTTRRTTVHGKLYVFSPVEDKDGQTHYVADVTNEQHAETLVGSGHFYLYGKENDKQPALARPTGGEQMPPPKEPADAALSAHSAEALAAASELLKGSISAVGRDVAKHGLDVVRAAVDVESAQQTPRTGMLALLNATLEGAAAAGVTG